MDVESEKENIMKFDPEEAEYCNKLLTEIGLLQSREVDKQILFNWLRKAYEMGVSRDKFSDQQSECDLPALDLSFVPKMKAELEESMQMTKLYKTTCADQAAYCEKIKKLEANLALCKSEGVPVGQILSDNEGLANDVEELTEKIKQLEAELAGYRESVGSPSTVKLVDGRIKEIEQLQAENEKLRKLIIYLQSNPNSPRDAFPEEYERWFSEDTKEHFDYWLVKRILKGTKE